MIFLKMEILMAATKTIGAHCIGPYSICPII